MTVAERRQALLLEWFYGDEERSGLGTVPIAKTATYWVGPRVRAWIYPPVRGARDRAYRDLKVLERNGYVTRGQTRGKATWWYA